MIEQVCAHINNYFTHERGKPIHLEEGEFTIEDGMLTLEFLKDDNYFLVRGSDFNDGIHLYPADDLKDETFTGRIYKMRPPRAFLDLVSEIEQWQTDYGKAAASPFSSENFEGYSYKKAQGYANSGGGMLSTWQAVFRDRLKPWRKLCL